MAVKESENCTVKQIKSSSDRILGINLTIGLNHLYLIGCLLPSTNMSLETYNDMRLELFNLYDELC